MHYSETSKRTAFDAIKLVTRYFAMKISRRLIELTRRRNDKAVFGNGLKASLEFGNVLGRRVSLAESTGRVAASKQPKIKANESGIKP